MTVVCIVLLRCAATTVARLGDCKEGSRRRLARLPIDASHSFPQRVHFHQALRLAEKATSLGVTSPLSVGCHSAATVGLHSAKEAPGLGLRNVACAHLRHELPLVRLAT